ncbi:FAD-dependent monooxygenase [Halalkalibacter krulwichiae]|uniref:3-hydroxybenzoate 6-hydroxylase 1 n=1 Tax=Halalkalibacter krulwichiae TaxID=199441 RepID=A0A1X9MGQ1_9BACI|nr:FAD-dependent monooxygenase [Halalkalibacter krulwichiae]ARK32606.1 3-hydroxybenzoate 6-hydroxylase 1 [Halalkalibacter krulwichiae]
MEEVKEVVIVGGGIGGLAAACGLGKLGKKVTLLEQAEEFGEVGAGLQVGPNGLRALDTLGVLDEVYKHAVFPRRHVFKDAITGKELSALVFGETFRERYGYPYIVIHRTDLHTVLLEACRSLDNITFKSNHRLLEVTEHDDHVELLCANGAVIRAEMVVGADGINSNTRKLISNDKLVPSEYVAYRFTVSASEMKLDIDWDEKFTWIGPGIHLVQYPVRHKSVINQVAVFKSQSFKDGSDNCGTVEELHQMFGNSCPTIRESLKFAEQGMVTKLFDRDPLDNWTSKRVTLLGDAAHPMLQYLAQGACQAIEDAVCLTRVMSENSDIDKVLSLYQEERIPRTAQVQRGARQWGEIKHAEDPTTILLRNTIMENRDAEDFKYLDWLYSKRTAPAAISLAQQ